MFRVLTLLVIGLFWHLSSFAQQPVLLPKPASVQYGSGQLPLRNLTVFERANTHRAFTFSINELKKWIEERSGSPVRKAASASAATVRYTVRSVGGELPGPNEATNGNKREAYRLVVTPKGIDITAETSAGLYYAVQTLRQLIQGSGPTAWLPTVTIDDKPRLAYRGVMMDFAHGGLLTVAEIKRQLDFLARWKTNQYYFYNEVSIQLDGFPTLNYKASYTKAEVKSIVEYARERHIDVIPFVNFYGHLHELIRNEKYADLAIGTYGHELDPRKPGVQTLLRNWIGQYMDLFTSPFIHVGFDETWETKRLAGDATTGLNPEALYIDQLKFVTEALKPYNKTVMAWTDMSSYYPDIIGKFPAEVVPVIWEYTPDSTAIYRYLNPVLKEKKPFFIQPAVSGWGHIYPASDYTYTNMDLCLQVGLKHQTRGYITSVWTDSVEPFVRASWLFMAYGGIGAWQGIAPDKASFTTAYSALVHPGIASELQQAYDHLATAGQYLDKCLGKNTQSLPRGTLIEAWSNPFSAYYLKNTTEHKTDFEAVRKHTEAAAEQLITAIQKAPKADRGLVNSLLVTARLVNYTAMRFLWAKAITDRWNEAMVVRKTEDFVFYDLTYPCHSLLVDAQDETGELKTAYAEAWLDECMPFRLNTMLGRFDLDFSLWRKLHLKVLDYKIQNLKTEPVPTFERLFTPDF
ncbi:family 20 glycosylhydrolase [Rudanella paleaurantiibacter]|uniref:beta-N-acetylhexosaminidase n=1 Tax=Rudanella paleaurantiibacter TaxID=2614655 RepID=A0A7J5U5S9_9BACT|nr:glycoside hydrolase family 20 zincin-like fold domain-containing protein [Rudanella paleaurantiibacter]KAB7733135.1 family 20 glycosylhydrolase [Rudanella paleaurantiibacter]